jgi:hypothetical protein
MYVSARTIAVDASAAFWAFKAAGDHTRKCANNKPRVNNDNTTPTQMPIIVALLI